MLDDASILFRAYSLTPREREVASLAAAGHSNESIAAQLDRVYTVKDHVKAVLAKTGAVDRAELARRFA